MMIDDLAIHGDAIEAELEEALQDKQNLSDRLAEIQVRVEITFKIARMRQFFVVLVLISFLLKFISLFKYADFL